MEIRASPILRDLATLLDEMSDSFHLNSIERELSPGDIESIRLAYLTLQDIKFSYRSNVRKLVTIEDISSVIEPLSRDFDAIVQTEFMEIANRLEVNNRIFRQRSIFRQFSSRKFKDIRSVGDAILSLHDLIKSVPRQLLLQIEKDDGQTVVERLKTIIPDQRVSPVRFDIISNKLVVVPKNAEPSIFDRDAILNARHDIAANGQRAVEELSQSNCDRRLVKCLEEMNAQILSGEDIVMLGIKNIEFSEMSAAFTGELPDIVSAMLKSHSVAVGMYAAQFPEWARFVDNAKEVEFDRKAITDLHELADSVASSLRKHPAAADLEVSKVINYLNSFISDPTKTTPKAGLAVLRTIENLVIRIYRYSIDLIEKTAEKSIEKISDKISSTVAKGTSATLIAVAIMSATGISPIVASVEGANWIMHTTELILKEFGHLTL